MMLCPCHLMVRACDVSHNHVITRFARRFKTNLESSITGLLPLCLCTLRCTGHGLWAWLRSLTRSQPWLVVGWDLNNWAGLLSPFSWTSCRPRRHPAFPQPIHASSDSPYLVYYQCRYASSSSHSAFFVAHENSSFSLRPPEFGLDQPAVMGPGPTDWMRTTDTRLTGLAISGARST